MELLDLKANVRTETGNGPARVLRREGRVPAILYGPDIAPMKMSIAAKDLENALKHGTRGHLLFNLDVEKGEIPSCKVMIKEMQTHPLSGEILHVDFYEFNENRKIRVSVPVVISGKSIGVEDGGVMQIIRRELEVLCLPMEIPESIEIDITHLNIGDSIHVKELPLEGNVEIPTDVNFTVVTILSPKREEAGVDGEGLGADMEDAATEGDAADSESDA